MSDFQESESVAQPSDRTTATPAPLPIGGLLWIPGIFLGFVTLLMLGTVAKNLQAPLTPLFAAIQIVNVFLPLFVTLKFFQRRRYVPLLIIGGSLFNAMLAIGFGPKMPPRAIAIAICTAAVLVGYFSSSKRVKQTFLL